MVDSSGALPPPCNYLVFPPTLCSISTRITNAVVGTHLHLITATLALLYDIVVFIGKIIIFFLFVRISPIVVFHN
jgi:hypothetical protein